MAAPLTASWRKIAEHEVLKRSSHAVAAVDGTAYVFGGELVSRQPKDGDVHVFSANVQSSLSQPKTVRTSSESPTPRVGASMVSLSGALYAFGGRGGLDMAALPESGGVWAFSPQTSAWSLLAPADPSAPFPDPRSYHASTTDGEKTIFVHAGCPASGRLRDFWAFDVWRMGGFDGEKEIGGTLDSFDLESGKWESFGFEADGVQGPGPRSVATLLPVVLNGRMHLVTVFGEADPSSLGHAGAGKMLGDIWALDVEERIWRIVDADGKKDGTPAARGWFGVAVVDESGVVVVGGLGEDNDRLGDAWSLDFK
ncbi:hypothetical protein Q7P37_011135 [Cladosporium fusiforme]